MTMEEKIARINALARKAKAEGLTDGEREEQAQLRRDYRLGEGKPQVAARLTVCAR